MGSGEHHSETLMTFTTAALDDALAAFARRFPGDSPARQPVHTVYGGAHLFKSDTPPKLGVPALKSLNEYGPDTHGFARIPGIPDALAAIVHHRVVAKTTPASGEASRTAVADSYGHRPGGGGDGTAGSGRAPRAVSQRHGLSTRSGHP